MKNILEYLEQTMTWLPEKAAFWDDKERLTFRELHRQARSVGTFLLNRGYRREGIAVCMTRGPKAFAAYLGCISAGCFFLALDEEMPPQRMARILETAQPRCILCDSETIQPLRDAGLDRLCVLFDTAVETPIDDAVLASVRSRQIDADPVCVLYVSGSSGDPRGVMLSHRNLLESTENLGALLKCSSNTVFGCQSPLTAIGAMKEWLCTLKYGASCYIIPNRMFSFPLRLVEALNRHRVNTLCWAASMLARITALDTFAHAKLETVTTVAFSEERMPPRQLCLWRKALPGARFWHLYGMTETGGACCWQEITSDPGPDSLIPLGTAFPNTAILLLDEAGREAETGEICIRGSCLAMGYYRDNAATGKTFVPGPSALGIPERILRTGDLATRNSRGQLVFLGRKDNRVKFRGIRIEPGEIESAAAAHPGIPAACCQFEEKTGKLQLFYTGECSCQELTEFLRRRLPAMMLPKSLYWLKFMPTTPSGTIDRSLLQRNSRQGVYGYEALARSG